MQRRTIFYSGTVQGVGFRWTAMRALAPLPVTGYVRNLRDGRVELVLEGEDGELDAATGNIRDALGGHIRDEHCATSTPTGEFAEFGIRR